MLRIILSVLIMLISISPLEAVPQKQATIQQIEKYFDGLKTYEADLMQINPDQSKAKGKFFLSRPEKFRVQYSEPKELILVSDGSFLIEYDPKEDIPNFLSLESTPANLLLKEKLKLSGDISVRDITQANGTLHAVLYKTKEPDMGTITLIFNEKPMSLVGWIIEDPQQNTTIISLRNVKENKPIKKDLFETSRITR